MKFDTSRFGTVEVAEDKLLHFEHGLPGFPDCTRFIVMDHDRETPLKWLQCVERPEIAFLIVEPDQILHSYEVDVPDSVLRHIGWKKGAEPSDVAVFVILNVTDQKLTANLRAPIVVNIAARQAFQMILENRDVSVTHPIGPTEDAPSSP